MSDGRTQRSSSDSMKGGNESKGGDSPHMERAYDMGLSENAGQPTGVPAEGTTMAEEAPAGVSKVEAFNKVLYHSGAKGKILLWLLAVSIGLTMFVYAMDQGITTTFFTAMATSTFGNHAGLAAVSVASQIIRAISKPFIGKLADLSSRPTTYVVVLVFYVIGFVVAASSHTFAAYAIGISFTAIGKSGLDLLGDIIVGDLTPLEWRGFFGSLLSIPFVITVPVNGFIADGLGDENWRWGLGMFCIMVPVLLAPAIWTLYTMQHRGQKLGMVTMASSKKERKEGAPIAINWKRAVIDALIEIDFFALILLGFAFALILLPFTLAKSAAGGWSNPSMIAMLVVGFVILGAFVLFEMYVSPKPLMSHRILRNRAFIAAVVIDVFAQCSSAVRNTYFFSYVYAVKPWSNYVLIIFLGITTIGLSLVGPIAGIVQRITHRYKTMMIIGGVGKLIGYGVLIEPGSNAMSTGTGRLLAAQLLLCLASFSVVGARVGSQASVPHEDLSTVIYLLSLWSTLGSSVGGAIASAIWTNTMLDQMRKELPDVPEATLKTVYGSIAKLRSRYPSLDDPIRQGVIRAYSQVNGWIAITACVLAAIPIIATFWMPDYYLGKQHNTITQTGLDGSRVEVPENERRVVEETGEKKSWLIKMRDMYRRDVL